jgi:hypothetical protein
MFYTMIWVVLCIVVIGLTKYLTMFWLKRVQNRMRNDNQDVIELRDIHSEKQNEFDDIEERNRKLVKKEAILSNIVSNLELTNKKGPQTDKTRESEKTSTPERQ